MEKISDDTATEKIRDEAQIRQRKKKVEENRNGTRKWEYETQNEEEKNERQTKKKYRTKNREQKENSDASERAGRDDWKIGIKKKSQIKPFLKIKKKKGKVEGGEG